jgi:hypothetical protein
MSAELPLPQPSRRTVVTAVAWSVPVLAAAIATPLAAASGPAFSTDINGFCTPGTQDVHDRGFTVTITGTLPAGSVISLSTSDVSLTNSMIEVSPNVYTNAQNGPTTVDYTLATGETDTVLTFWIATTALNSSTMTAIALSTPDDAVSTLFGIDGSGNGTCL